MKNKRKIVEVAIFAAITFLVLFLLPRYVIERVIVDGPSMETSLQDQDNILVEKVSRYFGALDRFDIVVFYPDEESKHTQGRYYIKRIIGLPGEMVQIVDGKIYIDGEELEESYGSTQMGHAGLAAEPIKLGEKEYFVLGDNRVISKDSRSSQVGIVPRSRIEGKLVLRLFPLKKFGTVND